MILENIVAQMLVSSGRKLYFFSRNERENSSETMEVDFLISTDKITSKHNIIPIEVKSGDRYTFTSLNKLRLKYNEYLAESVIIHTKDLKEENGATCILKVYKKQEHGFFNYKPNSNNKYYKITLKELESFLHKLGYLQK